MKKWIELLRRIVDFTTIEDNPAYQHYIDNAPQDELAVHMNHAVKTLLRISPYLAELEMCLTSYGETIRNLDVAIVPGIVLRRYDWNMYSDRPDDIYSLRIAVSNVSGVFKSYPRVKEIYPELSRLWLDFGNILIAEMRISRLWMKQYRLLCRNQKRGDS